MKFKYSESPVKFHSPKNKILRSEKLIIFAISATIALPMVDTLINVIANIEIWDSVVTLGTYYISLMLALYYSFKRLTYKSLVIPLIFLILAVISFVLFPDNRVFLSDQFFIPFFTASLPLFIITLAVKDYYRLFKALR